jgi:glycosyltransferase involved in cell wall biosynthesis
MLPPAVSVALCTHNGAKFLQAQLASIAAQTRPPDELVISDDDSSDGTNTIVEAFAGKAPFAVRRLHNRPALGIAQNFARAVGECRGEVIFLCDQDDIWQPVKIQTMIAALAAQPDKTAAFSDLDIFDVNGQEALKTQWQLLGLDDAQLDVLEGPRAWEPLLRFSLVTGSALALRSSLRDRVLPVPPGWLHDEWIAFWAAARGELLPVRQALTSYRRHDLQHVGPATSGLWAQYRYAKRQMNRSYFARLVMRAQALSTYATRLEPDNARLCAALREYVAHLNRRLELRASQPRRVGIVAKEFLRGNYSRFGYGWKSAAQDLLL